MYANVRRDLPGWLRQLRIDRKLSQAQLAKRLNVSKSYVSQIESGKLIPQDDTAKALDLVYGTGDEIQKAAKDAREDRQPWLRSWFDQEQRAVLLRTWEPMLVPGLLQCESYMRAVFSAVPSNAGQIDDLVAKRLERQANTIYRESAPVALSAIIGEVALRRGPRDVLKEQLGHLIDTGDLPHVKIRLIPMESEGIHAGLSGAFVIASMSDGRRVGFMDDQIAGHVVTDNDGLRHLELAWEEVDALALPVALSRDVMLRMLDEHK